jgi:hypothetical protein
MILRQLRQAGFVFLVLAAATTFAASRGNAQPQPSPNKLNSIPGQNVPVPVIQGLNSDAREVREQLNQLFQQYPPSLRIVLQLDPTLLSNANYVALYPSLATFLSQHPEVAHNPAYFVGTRTGLNDFNQSRDSLSFRIGQIIEPMAVASVFIVLIGVLGWIIRSIMNHRRWLRVSKLQSDMQNKLLERFTSNEEMLAFIQTSAGQRFLESASMAAESGPRVLSAPVGRMLWSIQLGIVILVAGLGLEIVSYKLSNYEDVVTGFQVMGGIIIALGIGFILSAFGAFLLSRRLGLTDPSPTPSLK